MNGDEVIESAVKIIALDFRFAQAAAERFGVSLQEIISADFCLRGMGGVMLFLSRTAGLDDVAISSVPPTVFERAFGRIIGSRLDARFASLAGRPTAEFQDGWQAGIAWMQAKMATPGPIARAVMASVRPD